MPTEGNIATFIYSYDALARRKYMSKYGSNSMETENNNNDTVDGNAKMSLITFAGDYAVVLNGTK